MRAASKQRAVVSRKQRASSGLLLLPMTGPVLISSQCCMCLQDPSHRPVCGALSSWWGVVTLLFNSCGYLVTPTWTLLPTISWPVAPLHTCCHTSDGDVPVFLNYDYKLIIIIDFFIFPTLSAYQVFLKSSFMCLNSPIFLVGPIPAPPGEQDFLRSKDPRLGITALIGSCSCSANWKNIYNLIKRRYIFTFVLGGKSAQPQSSSAVVSPHL